MFIVQEGRRGGRNKELAAIGVWARVLVQRFSRTFKRREEYTAGLKSLFKQSKYDLPPYSEDLGGHVAA
jgi:hypothetical protein